MIHSLSMETWKELFIMATSAFNESSGSIKTCNQNKRCAVPLLLASSAKHPSSSDGAWVSNGINETPWRRDAVARKASVQVSICNSKLRSSINYEACTVLDECLKQVSRHAEELE